MSAERDALIGQCRNEALRLLRENLTADGIMAARATEAAEARRYTRVFGRDAAICALGMVASGDSELIEGARRSLLTLAEHQAENGQIPKYVDPAVADSDFWYVGCIDATLWWLIAVRFLAEHAPDTRFQDRVRGAVERALVWLHCQEHPRLKLLQQNEASDWADIMPRSGFVLYSNALWYRVKRDYALAHQEETRHHFEHLFFPFSQEVPEYRRLRLLGHYVRNRAENRDLYLSFVNFSFWGEEGDVFGNLLAVLFGLADDGHTNRILRSLREAHASEPYPVRAVTTPIRPHDPLWRDYMARHRQNYAWQYHNGGCWPFIGGFLVLVLGTLGRSEEATEALYGLARANRVRDWEFNEWFHAQTGAPSGMAGQSWNAAMFILAQESLQRSLFAVI